MQKLASFKREKKKAVNSGRHTRSTLPLSDHHKRPYTTRLVVPPGPNEKQTGFRWDQRRPIDSGKLTGLTLPLSHHHKRSGLTWLVTPPGLMQKLAKIPKKADDSKQLGLYQAHSVFEPPLQETTLHRARSTPGKIAKSNKISRQKSKSRLNRRWLTRLIARAGSNSKIKQVSRRGTKRRL